MTRVDMIEVRENIERMNRRADEAKEVILQFINGRNGSIIRGAVIGRYLENRIPEFDFRCVPMAMQQLGFVKGKYRKQRAWKRQTGNGSIMDWEEQ